MRPKVKFKRSFVYTKTLGHLQESPDLTGTAVHRGWLGSRYNPTNNFAGILIFFFLHSHKQL